MIQLNLMKRKLIWFILALALVVRVVGLQTHPYGFNADETSFGYDSYSLISSGRDQWGNFLPLVFKSFGDYKSPLYGYLSVPFVAFFGLNILSTRILSVIMGTAAIYVTYLLTKKVVKSEGSGLIAAILLAMNPWAIMISRGAVEAGLMVFFIPLGAYLFLSKRYFAANLIFGISLFTYHSAKIIVPLLFVLLVFLNRQVIGQIRFKRLIAPIILLVIFSVLLFMSFKYGGGTRITERSITQGALLEGFNERMSAINNGKNPFVAKIFHNKYTVTVKRFKNNFLQYFSLKYLLTSGAGDASYAMVPGIGVLNLAEIILLVGIFPLIFSNSRSGVLLLPVLWLVIGVLPAALASGIGYSANRAAGMLPVLQLLAAIGATGWQKFLTSKTSIKPEYFSKSIALIFIISAGIFLNRYSKIPENKYLRQMNYGYLDMARWLEINTPGRKVVISRSLSEPQIFLAFANKINPEVFAAESKNWDLQKYNVSWVDQLPEYSLERYKVKSIKWNEDYNGDNLLVLHATEQLNEGMPLKTFYYPDGTPNILIVDSAQKIYAKNTR